MEPDRLLVAAGLTAAAVVGAFVFWGPPTGSSRGRGRLAGLVNLGQTCFLNTLLQALAACPQFIAWLNSDPNVKDTSLRGTLATVLSVVNGTHVSMRHGPYAPESVISALKRLGWAIPVGEQDAHELFHVILSTLDEETPKPSRQVGCLSDALGLDDKDSPPRDSSSPETFEMEPSASVLSLSDMTASLMSDDGQIGRPQSLHWRSGLNRRHRWISRSCRALGLTGPPPQPTSHPFSGTLTSQLKCTVCGHKTAVRYDKFESLSLPLPSGMGDLGWGRYKLHEILTHFVTPEVVHDVACDGCNRGREPELDSILSKQLKILNFGKLPSCLCIHISRNMWHPSGRMSKRQDYVQFPVRLSLASYTFLQAQYQRKLTAQMYTSTSEGGSPLSNSMPTNWGTPSITDNSKEWRHVYQLAAVVVHTGDAHSGHFATYRRGHHETSAKWFFTSDVEIREASMEEVLQSTAYMLFYEKCTRLGTF